MNIKVLVYKIWGLLIIKPIQKELDSSCLDLEDKQ